MKRSGDFRAFKVISVIERGQKAKVFIKEQQQHLTKSMPICGPSGGSRGRELSAFNNGYDVRISEIIMDTCSLAHEIHISSTWLSK